MLFVFRVTTWVVLMSCVSVQLGHSFFRTCSLYICCQLIGDGSAVHLYVFGRLGGGMAS